MRHYQEQVATGKMSAAEAEAKIADLEQQIKRHEAALADLDVAGPGKISVGDTNADARAAGYPEVEGHHYVRDPGGEFQLELLPGSDAVPRKVSRGADGKIKVETVPLDPPARRPTSADTEAARTKLAGDHAAHTFEIPSSGGDLIRIDGQVNVHADFIAQLKARGEWDGFLAATADLRKHGGDVARTDAATKEVVRKYRLAAETAGESAKQRAFIDPILKDLGLMTASGEYTSAQARALFTDLDASAVAALKRFQDQKGGKKAGPDRAAAVEYALSKHPATVNEVINLVEVWWEKFEARSKQLWASYQDAHDKARDDAKARGASGDEVTEARKAVGQAYFGVDFPKTADAVDKARGEFSGEAGHRALDASYAESRADVVGRTGAVDLPAGSDADLVGRLKANLPNFGSESATLYHAEKHYAELPASEQTGKKAANYLDSLGKTISSPDSVVGPEVSSTGARQVIFHRTVEGARLEAIVYVQPNGRAVVATYGAAKSGK
jgi:hypothetical protein